jgi:TonB family protein
MNRILAVAFACCLSSAAVPAQTATPAGQESAEADRLGAQVAALYREAKFAEAIPLARRVLEIRERAHGPHHASVALALYNLGALHFEERKDAEAGPLLARALAAGEKLGGPARQLVIDASNKLAEISHRKGQLKETDAHLRRALDLTVAARGETDEATLPYLLNLTDLSFRRRKEDEAETYLGRALKVILARPPQLDGTTAERLRSYFCLIPREVDDKPLMLDLSLALERLEEPGKVRERERLAAERKARGEKDPEVEGGVLTGRAVAKPQPAYPVEARRERAMGRVVVRVVVNEEGKVIHAKRLCGHRLLSPAAVRAVYNWRFTPTTLDGAPVTVNGTVTINFVIQ